MGLLQPPGWEEMGRLEQGLRAVGIAAGVVALVLIMRAPSGGDAADEASVWAALTAAFAFQLAAAIASRGRLAGLRYWSEVAVDAIAVAVFAALTASHMGA